MNMEIVMQDERLQGLQDDQPLLQDQVLLPTRHDRIRLLPLLQTLLLPPSPQAIFSPTDDRSQCPALLGSKRLERMRELRICLMRLDVLAEGLAEKIGRFGNEEVGGGVDEGGNERRYKTILSAMSLVYAM